MTMTVDARTDSGLSVTRYNRDIAWLGPEMPEENWDSVREMLDVYSPFGEVRTVLTSLRPGIGFDGYQGSATAMSMDHALQRIIGLPALPAGLDRDLYGGGKGLTLEDSVLSSLGEAIERMIGAFSSITPATDAIERWCSAADLDRSGERYIGPDQLSLFAPEQFEQPGFLCEPWSADDALRWCRGTDLLTDEQVWVPAQLVHLFYIRHTGEARIGVSSSGGLATHLNRSNSLAHGILELIERDAANLSWYCRTPPRPIVFDRPFRDLALRRWMRSAQRAGVEVTFYAHRTDVPDVCVVTAISVEDELAEYNYLAGGGVGVDAEAAIRSAIAELVQSERMVRTPKIAPSWRIVQGFNRLFGIAADAANDDFDNFIQVVPYYGYAQNQRKLDWYLRDPDVPTVGLSELPTGDPDATDPLETVLDVCRGAGLTPIAFDLTPDGFSSVRLTKVFIPELVQAFPPNMQMLGHSRYSTFARRMGQTDHDLSFSELTTDPLPYP